MKKFTAILLSLLMMLQAVPFAGLAESAGNAAEDAGTIWSDWYTIPSDPAGEALYRNVQFTVLGETVATLSVADGATVEALPEAPKLQYLSFVGWYDGNTPFTAETPVTGDMVVRGVYTKANPVVEALKLASDYMFEDTGAYVAFSVFGTHKKNQQPSAHRTNVEARDGLTVTDAWTVDNIKNNSRLMAEAVVTSLPAGGSLIAYGIVNGRLGDPLGDPLAVGDKVLVDLTMKGLQGVAFVTDAAPAEEEEPVQLVDSGMLYANDDLYITGKVPGNGVIDVQPVKVSVNGAEALAAYDIKIYANENQQAKGKPWQPADKKVQVHFYNEAFADKQLDVYHLADEKSPAEFVASVQAENGWIAFDAASFSVYAVVDGATGDNSRLAINFWAGDNSDVLIATMYVKPGDSDDAIPDIVYDPGVGSLHQHEIFRGWIVGDKNGGKPSYTPADADSDRIKTIDDIRELVKSIKAQTNGITEGDTIDVVAALYNAFNITYLDPFGIALNTDSIMVMPTQTQADYNISGNYEPIDDTHLFEGWHVSSGGTNIQDYDPDHLYQYHEDIVVTGDVTFSATQAPGHWLVFNENGKGATYNAPQFVKAEDVTREPSIEMVRNGYTFGGWYTDADCTDGNEFTFGSPLTDNTTIYAKWIPAETANYTVLIWKENIAGDGYDFVESIQLSGNVGSVINTVSTSGSGDTAYAVVNGVAKQYPGFHWVETEYDPADRKINTEGTAVVHVRYARNTVTLNYYVFSPSGGYSQATGNDQYGQYYGRFNNNGYPSSNGSNYRILYRLTNGNWGYPTDGNYDRRYGYHYNEAGPYVVEFSNTRYIRNGTWSLYTTTSGRFETLLSENNFTWPTAYNWYTEQGEGGGAGGTRLTFLDAYLPSNPADTVVNLYAQDVVGDVSIRFYKQNPDNPDQYDLANTVTASGGTFFISDKYHGFEAYQFRVDGGSWQSAGNKDSEGTYNDGEGVQYTTGLDIRFNRLKYPVLYYDGIYVDGNGNKLDEPNRGELKVVNDIVYGSNISSFNKDGDDYYEPTYNGYVFEGWYLDDACTQPYTFTTMPEGITVYAKWRQVEYRVFLHPNVPSSDTSLNWGSETQSMTFRRALGDKVSLPTGTRTEYEFVGWYTSPSLSPSSLFTESTVLNESTVTTPYDKTTDFTDPMDKYGEGATYNNDDEAHANRFWITKKLDLYAKWRKVLEGADGIGIVYDANGGTNPPEDTYLYLDSAMATAYPAPTAPEGQVFLYWVVQTWDGTKYVDKDIIAYPGDTFEVLKDDAQIVDLGPDPETGKPRFTYTVQLRAEYKPIEDPKPTHIWWYRNDPLWTDPARNTPDKDNVITETGEHTENMFINQAVNIHAKLRATGFTFLGWARKTIAESGSMDEGNTTHAGQLFKLGEDDLYLKYEDGVYKVQTDTDADGDGENDWVPVTSVAADEETPYHDMYAVWEQNTDVPVEKIWEPVVEGVDFSAYQTDTVTVELLWNGNSYEPKKTAVLSASEDPDENWKYLFKGLPTRDDNNKKIKFSIVETVPEGWQAAYTPAYVTAFNKTNVTNPLKVTNTPIYGSIISLSKKVAGLEEDVTGQLSNVAFTVKGPKQDDDTYKNTYTYHLSDFTKTDNGDGTYTFTLAPEDLAFVEAGEYIFYEGDADLLGAWGYSLTAATSEDNPVTITLPTASQASGAITNTYERRNGNLTVNKTVTGHTDGKFPYTVKLKNSEGWWLKGTGTTADPYVLAENETDAGEYQIPRTEGTLTGTLTLTAIPVGTYTVVEQGTEEGGSAQIDYHSLEVTYDPETDEVTPTVAGEVGVINTYTRTTVPVTLKKVVGGNLADVNKMFPFTLQLLKEDGTTPLVIDGLTDENGMLPAVSLKHEGTAELGQLPIGAKLKINEGDAADYNTAYKADGTDPLFPIDTDTKEAVITIPELSGTMTSVDIVFGNYANLVIPTGVRLDTTPYLFLMALALLGAAWLLIRRRKENG